MPSYTALYPLSLHDALPIYSVDTGVVKLDPLSDPVRTTSQNQHLGLVRSLALILSVVGGVEVGRLCRELTGTGVHQFEHRFQVRSEEHTSELQSRGHLVCRLTPHSTLFPYTTLFRSTAWTQE